MGSDVLRLVRLKQGEVGVSGNATQYASIISSLATLRHIVAGAGTTVLDSATLMGTANHLDR
jgi:hypothetical protein